MSEDLSINHVVKDGESDSEAMARMIFGPHARHAFLRYSIAGTLFKDQRPAAEALITLMADRAAAVNDGDLTAVSEMLVAQAGTLDALFGEFTHRALINRSEYPDAFQRYMNLALKTQAQSRATLEALARMHQPREQVVRHVHVYEGGQAVVAEQFHAHSGGAQNAGIAHQPYGPRAPGAPMLGTDASGYGVPVSSDARPEKVPDSRWGTGQRGSKGKSKRSQTRPQVAPDEGTPPRAERARR